MAIREDEAVDLVLDGLNLNAWVVLKTSHVDLIIEVTNVADDCIILHLCHLVSHDNAEVARGGDKDISSVDYR